MIFFLSVPEIYVWLSVNFIDPFRLYDFNTYFKEIDKQKTTSSNCTMFHIIECAPYFTLCKTLLIFCETLLCAFQTQH